MSISSVCGRVCCQSLFSPIGNHKNPPHCSHSVCSAEQECHLLQAQVDDHHLDQNPGYKIKDKGAANCDNGSKLTFAECKEARVALDSKAIAVVNTTDVSLPTGCYRQQQDQYRFEHDESSYKWFFNTVAGQPDSNSEPVCKGKAKRSCLCTHSRHIMFIRVAYL